MLQESFSFWLVVAKQSCDRLRNLEAAWEIASRLRFVKVKDHGQPSFQSEAVQYVEHTKRNFGMKGSEQFILSAECDRLRFDGEAEEFSGRLIIFTNWVVWQATGGGGECDSLNLCATRSQIAFVVRNGNSLDIATFNDPEVEESVADIANPLKWKSGTRRLSDGGSPTIISRFVLSRLGSTADPASKIWMTRAPSPYNVTTNSSGHDDDDAPSDLVRSTTVITFR